MGKNYGVNFHCGIVETQIPGLSNDVDLVPEAEFRWGLGYMLNLGPGRTAGAPAR